MKTPLQIAQEYVSLPSQVISVNTRRLAQAYLEQHEHAKNEPARDVFRDVAAFHEATNTPVLDKPQWPGPEREVLRDRLIREEYSELYDAWEASDLVWFADSLCDLIYVLVGTMHEFGIPPEVWDEVQKSNMAKRDPVTGKVKKREDGKVLKPEGWTPPDIAGILGVR